MMLFVLAVAVLTARAVIDGNREMQMSDVAFDRGDLRVAIDHARRAAVLYAPGAPHVAQAYARLDAIALGAEAAGQQETARMAWRAVRGAALETRHVWIPERAELGRANQNLARLEAVSSGASSARAARLARKRALAELERDSAPAAVWVMLLSLGFLLSLGGLWLVALRGVTRDGRLVLTQARLGLILTLVGAACWTLAVWRA
jgi:hypothetical protein